MTGWTRHDGTAVALPRDNIDTDQLIPARFMSASRAEGYGQFLLRDLREGDPGFPLDRFPQASILLAGRNFGCGSSREAAVYALVDAGIRCVIAPSFGDIFAANAVNNGLLPARVAETPAMMQALAGGTAPASIDLKASQIEINGTTLTFDLAPAWRTKLINGWDDIDLTRAHLDEIRSYRNQRHERQRWSWPAPQDPQS
ncbi:3-isopropylmalate dehydratase small subunit [Puniceibacterium sediminis]|uniref:3-isopropylmalate dehydratase n=1 Tax=Puniceibacterium sediminis TaxID=1608407 RepID=A0A238Y7F2_9RHOB|nr:3-isopropylmalate dehydratase small subunit [Puniceibacterium sediminis]SNR66882.1 3-isopropylmalate/(R)-2-methylmalate dehydratase small subunit [Puniceibacterium sediminis]